MKSLVLFILLATEAVAVNGQTYYQTWSNLYYGTNSGSYYPTYGSTYGGARASLKISIVWRNATSVSELAVKGIPGDLYDLEWSSDLKTWFKIGRVPVGPNGRNTVDVPMEISGRKFFRLSASGPTP